MREPAGQSRLERRDPIGPHVQVAAGGTSAQPLDRPADHEIDPPAVRVHLEDTGRLVGVEEDQGADAARSFDDRSRVETVRAPVRHVRQGYQGRVLVDGVQQPVHRRRQAVVGGNDRHFDARPPLRLPHVPRGREIQGGGHDLPSAPRAQIEARDHRGERHGRVRLHLHGAGPPAQDARDEIADLVRQVPPVLRPDVLAHLAFPEIHVGQKRPARGPRHGSETVAEKMDAGFERGKLVPAAIDRQRHRRRILPCQWPGDPGAGRFGREPVREPRDGGRLVDGKGIEPSTSALRTRRSPS